MVSFLESMTTPLELGPIPMDTTPGMLSKTVHFLLLLPNEFNELYSSEHYEPMSCYKIVSGTCIAYSYPNASENIHALEGGFKPKHLS